MRYNVQFRNLVKTKNFYEKRNEKKCFLAIGIYTFFFLLLLNK